jgi:hypothetical protein
MCRLDDMIGWAWRLRSSWMRACLGVVVALGIAAQPSLILGETTLVRAQMGANHREFLTANCGRCHDANEANGGVRLDDLPLEIADVGTAERWQKVLGVLNSGEMPPEDEPQPAASDKEAFLEVLSKQMVVARKALADSGGVIAMRRLNRREYVNTIQDLLDVTVDAGDLPADIDGGAFDTIGSSLFFSSDQFENMIKIARAALDEAIVTGGRPTSKTERQEPEVSVNASLRPRLEKMLADRDRLEAWRKSGKPASEIGHFDERSVLLAMQIYNETLPKLRPYVEDPQTATGVMLQPVIGNLGHLVVRVPPTQGAGTYRFRVRAAVAEADVTTPRYLEYGVPASGLPAGEFRVLGSLKVEGTVQEPDVLEFEVFLPRAGNREVRLRDPTRRAERYQAPYKPTIWIDWVEWAGPLLSQWPPRSHTAVLGDIDLAASPSDDQARVVVRRFAERAFRGRPVRDDYVDRLMTHYMDRRAAGEKFVEAVKTPLSLVLASPNFLYLSERPATNDADGGSIGRRPLSDVELANRLSYFLWSGPPDEPLMALARAGQLHEPAVLAAEVDRLIDDDRFRRFVSGFTHQWLHMVRLDFFQFNPQLYPEFITSVKESARREVFETVQAVIRDRLPLGTLLSSDHVVVNDQMADYYGISGVDGPQFRWVAVPPGVPRGGLLGMAAIHAMGSDGERTSPVERGAWVLRKLLHDPPPPAPANVPQLTRFAGKPMSARELMTAHQEQPQCAQCHRWIDPIGYGLEHFNAVGLWRTEDVVVPTKSNGIKKRVTFSIDATGSLRDGTTFNGFTELRAAVARHEAAFARGFTEHLIEFALGRPCGFSDEELVADILHQASPAGYTPRALIQSLVASRQFHSK